MHQKKTKTEALTLGPPRPGRVRSCEHGISRSADLSKVRMAVSQRLLARDHMERGQAEEQGGCVDARARSIARPERRH